MALLTNCTLRTKLVTLGIVLSAMPMVILVLVAWRQNTLTQATAREGSTRMAYEDLDRLAANVYEMCGAYQPVLQQQVTASLAVARDLAKRQGNFGFSADRQFSWNAVNQFTKGVAGISLPEMQLGQTGLGQVADPKVPLPLVDEVRDLVGGTCTVFQRMNATGDMLRVCTSVIGQDGRRAVGSYIPAVNPDGQPNPVVAQRARDYLQAIVRTIVAEGSGQVSGQSATSRHPDRSGFGA